MAPLVYILATVCKHHGRTARLPNGVSERSILSCLFWVWGARGISHIISFFSPDEQAPSELSTNTNPRDIIHREHESKNFLGRTVEIEAES